MGNTGAPKGLSNVATRFNAWKETNARNIPPWRGGRSRSADE